MRMLWFLAGLLVGGELVIAMNSSNTFSVGAWYTCVTLLVFSGVGWTLARREYQGEAAQPIATDGAARRR